MEYNLMTENKYVSMYVNFRRKSSTVLYKTTQTVLPI